MLGYVVAVAGGSAAVEGEDDDEEGRGKEGREGRGGEWGLVAVVESSVWRICRRSGWI